MKIKQGTMLFSLTLNGVCDRIKLLNGEHPNWRYKVKRTGFGLWQLVIV